MLENSINKNRVKTIYTLFPKNKRLRLSKQNLKYLAKEHNLDNSENPYSFNNLKNNITKNTKSNQANSYSKKKLNFNSTNNKWDYNYKINKSKPKFNIASSTSIK